MFPIYRLNYNPQKDRCYKQFQNNNSQIKTFNQILDVFENDSNMLLLATGPEDSLRSFAFRIKPLLESFDEWISSVHTQTQNEFLRKNIII